MTEFRLCLGCSSAQVCTQARTPWRCRHGLTCRPGCTACMPPGTCLTHEWQRRCRDTLCSRPQHRKCSCTALATQERHRNEPACFLHATRPASGRCRACTRDCWSPAPRPPTSPAGCRRTPRWAAAERQQRNASSEMPAASCCKQLLFAERPLAAEERSVHLVDIFWVSGVTCKLACDACSQQPVRYETVKCCRAGERHQRRRRRGRRDPKGRRALAGPRHQPPDRHRRPGRRRLVRRRVRPPRSNGAPAARHRRPGPRALGACLMNFETTCMLPSIGLVNSAVVMTALHCCQSPSPWSPCCKRCPLAAGWPGAGAAAGVQLPGPAAGVGRLGGIRCRGAAAAGAAAAGRPPLRPLRQPAGETDGDPKQCLHCLTGEISRRSS